MNVDVKEKKHKTKLGQFFTKKDVWLRQHIKDFIINSKTKIVYDPFAGNGDLLSVVKNFGYEKTIGLDIDKKLKWEINDSLVNIPHIDNAIIITNPPYIAKQSATRHRINLKKYYNSTIYDDIYLLALDKMLEAQDYVVAIIPESFINSIYKQKNKLYSITILEENPFEDTENPVCVACFDGCEKTFEKIKIYKEDKYINNLAYFENLRLEPKNDINISFNDKKGWLALRATDSSNGQDVIHFCFKKDMDYDFEKNIKVSSRHISLLNIDVKTRDREKFINESNKIIAELRANTSDIIFTPFKGNTKFGIRRRRLDFRLARAILEKAYNLI